MKRLVLLALFVLAYLGSPSGQQSVAAQEVFDPDYCPMVPPWFDARDELGGSYISNGWSAGFLSILRLTAIGGQVQGFLIESSVEDDGSEEQSTYSVAGIYDEVEVSLQIDFFFGTLTMVGTWDDGSLRLTYPDGNGGVFTNNYVAIDDDDALELLAAWEARNDRNAAAATALSALAPAWNSLPYPSDLSTEPARILSDRATMALGMPHGDSLSLLSFGWLASAEFTARAEGSLPNQLNRYAVHLTRSLANSYQIASCIVASSAYQEGFDRSDELPRADLVLVRASHGSDEIPGNTEILAISGGAVVTALVYGSESVRETAVLSTLRILEAGGF